MSPLATMLVLAHQGGWDEILLVATPIAIFVGLLWLANRRADAALAAHKDPGADPTDSEPTDSDPTDCDPTDDAATRPDGAGDDPAAPPDGNLW